MAPRRRKRDPLNADLLKMLDQIEALYKQYEKNYKETLVEGAAKAFVNGDLTAQAALDIKLSFRLVNQEALKYIEKYREDLERGGSYIQGEWTPWLSDMTNEDRSEIARIIEEGYKKGKPTGVKQYQKPGIHGLYPKNSIANDLQKYFTGRRSHAATVARTEIARIQSHGSLNRYRKQGVKKVEWLVFNPCDICSQYARKVFPIDELPREVPAHPNCRCALAPVPDEVPAGPAPELSIPAVFERTAKAL